MSGNKLSVLVFGDENIVWGTGHCVINGIRVSTQTRLALVVIYSSVPGVF